MPSDYAQMQGFNGSDSEQIIFILASFLSVCLNEISQKLQAMSSSIIVHDDYFGGACISQSLKLINVASSKMSMALNFQKCCLKR